MIFYFSGTGNSKAVAKMLSEGLGDQLVDMGVGVRSSSYKYSIASREMVGIVCPIYNWGLPTLVVSFLQQMQLPAKLNPFIYVVFTCGGSIGCADKQLNEVLDNRGYALSAAYSVPMPDNYILSFNLLSSPVRITELLNAAPARVGLIIEAIKERRPVESLLNRGHFPRLATAFCYPAYRNGRSTEPFYSTSACVGCGLCERVCSIGAIKLYDNHPVWLVPTCVTCLACLHRCPQRALPYGSKTEHRGRYVHPDLE